jgi:deoxyribodipyrimidine photo-lyase
MSIAFHWFRRDLRFDDNHALFKAFESGHTVIPVFIFDSEILDKLDEDDARVQFLHDILSTMDEKLRNELQSALLIKHGSPLKIWEELIAEFKPEAVFVNRDYEPYAIGRDTALQHLLESKGISFKTFKDQVIFEPGDVLKDDGGPYTVYTPYSNKCFKQFSSHMLEPFKSEMLTKSYYDFDDKKPTMLSLSDIGFRATDIRVEPYDINESLIKDYQIKRNTPGIAGTSKLGPHLRFGTVSVRAIMAKTMEVSETFAKELFWREFFMQIMHHFPHVIGANFRAKYDVVPWRNDEQEFEKWCKGETGYAFVDAGMRELNETGYMHNRVRMIVSGFLCKHLLIDWQWGEAYFAKKLLDFELASNNGNWQWAAGTGCDAAPYFRVFNPITQKDKFDKNRSYIGRWVPEHESENYQSSKMVEHKMARERAIAVYKEALS